MEHKNPNAKYSHEELYIRLNQGSVQLLAELCGQKESIENWNVEVEVDYNRSWDIVINFAKQTTKVKDTAFHYSPKMYIEYKSSIKEWDKGFLEHLRQIKKRIKDIPLTDRGISVVLLTPDTSFEKFRTLLENEGITLVVLSEDDWNNLK